MSGLRIAYSNSYDVLKAQLLDAVTERIQDAETESIFNALELVTPSKEVDDDLRRSITENPNSGGVCIGLKFERLDEWLTPYGNFWRESSFGVLVLHWKIFSILKRIDAGDYEGRPEFVGLRGYLKSMQRGGACDDASIDVLSQKISAVFTKYVNYRIDWVLEWLGVKTIGTTPIASIRPHERERLQEERVFFPWQKALWQEIQALEQKDNEKHLRECYTEQLAGLVRDSASAEGKNEEPLYVFLPHALPPLALPILAQEASCRDVTLFIQNPCCEYWFDANENSVPKNLFEGWKSVSGKNTLLHANATSTRAFIDRLWQFYPDDEIRDAYLPMEEREATSVRPVTSWKRAAYNPQANAFLFPREQNTSQTFFWVERQVRQGRKSLSLLDAIGNSVLHDRSLRSEQPDTLFLPEAFDPVKDVSLRIAGASTLTRELEGLIDWINAIRARDDSLRGEDILVVCPNIDKAEPLIRGVFGALPKDKRIDYEIVGALGTIENVPLVLGGFLYSRAAYDDFMALLGLPLFSTTWQLNYEDIRLIAHWLARAGYRYGINDTQLDAMVLRGEVHLESQEASIRKGVYDGTLERSIERLSLGFSSASGIVFGDTRALDGTEGELFENESVSHHPETFKKLLQIYSILTTIKPSGEDSEAIERTWESEKSVSDWAAWCNDLVDRVFSYAHSNAIDQAKTVFTSAYRQTLKAIAEGYARGDAKVSFDAFWGAIKRSLRDAARVNQRDGAVTFAGLRDLRHLPFNAIAMIGMNESANFPGTANSEEFDLTMSLRDEDGKPCRRRGDRDSRADNRNIFLDYLLAARRYVLISYESGFEPKSAPSNPSIVVQEFMQWLQTEGFDTNRITYTLPLTRYSRKGFLATAPKDARFFNSIDMAACRALRTARADAPTPFVPTPCLPIYAASGEDQEKAWEAFIEKPVLFKDFVDAWREPERFIEKRLGIRDERKDADVAPAGFLCPNDGLFEYNVKRDFQCQSNAEAYAQELCLDPQYGFSALRGEFLSQFVEDKKAFEKARGLLFAGRKTSLLENMELPIHVGGNKPLKVKLPSLIWVEPNPMDPDDKGFVYLESLSQAQKERYGVLRLLLLAMGYPKTRLIAEFNKKGCEYEDLPRIGEIDFAIIKKKRGSDDFTITPYAKDIDPHQIGSAAAKEVIEALGRFYIALMKRVVLIPQKPLESTLLTRGRANLFDLSMPTLKKIQESWIFGTKERAGGTPRGHKDENVEESLWVVHRIDEILAERGAL